MTAAIHPPSDESNARTGLEKSDNLAGLIKIEAGRARIRRCGVAVAETANKIHVAVKIREKFGLHLVLAESRHRAAIEAERAGRQHEISRLQSPVARCGFDNKRLFAAIPFFH